MATVDLSSLTKVSIGDMALSTLLSAIFSFLVCFIVIKLVMQLVDKLMVSPSVKLDGTIKGFLRNAIHILLWAVAVIIVANALGIDTTSLIAVVSIAGLALSLSVQNILANLFSGLTLLITKPFAAGNFVEAAGKRGLVKTVGLFYTTMDTLDNVSISIPNSEITGSTIFNYSREPLRRVDMTFSTSYDAGTEEVKAAINEVIEQDSRILRNPAPFVRLSAYKSSCIEYTVRVWVANGDYWDVYFDMNENVRESFKRHDIAMTYEHLNVHIEQK